jgi:hypothetical protein
LTKVPKTYNGEKTASSTNVACRKLKLDPNLSPCTSTNSKCIKDLNVRPETWKRVQEKAENTLELIDIVNDFLNKTQLAQQLREIIDQ